MKKIIALAVAGAFVGPAMATDLSIGGHVEYLYRDNTGAEARFDTGETEINIRATDELSNGYTITAAINIIDDNGEDEATTAGNEESLDLQGSNLNIAGPIGSITIGDASGALDSTGDWTDVSPTAGGFNGDGDDHAVLYVLPTFVEGLTVAYSYSPSGTNDMGAGTGVTDDATSYSFTYNAELGSVYAGKETDGVSDYVKSYGVRATISGVTLAAETGESSESGTKYDMNGLAATYGFNDFVLSYEKQTTESQDQTDTDQEETVISVEYNWGSNVDIYVSAVDINEATVDTTSTRGSTADATVVGIEYTF